MRRPSSSTLFPYTTLFRSRLHGRQARCAVPVEREARDAGEPGRHRDVAGDVPAAVERLTEHDVVEPADRKSTRLNSSHPSISYAVFCLKKKIDSSAPYWSP